MQESMHLLKISKKPMTHTVLHFCVITFHQKKNEKKALQTIKDFAIKTSHKKGLRYEYQKSQILYLWDLLKGRASNAKVYTAISAECGMSEEAIRKIIVNI